MLNKSNENAFSWAGYLV